MADNVPITPGIGATIATDDVGGAQYQRVKLDVGADGASVPVVGALPVSAAALPLPAGAATAAGVAAVVTALGTPAQAGGAVAVSNFPATQPVSGPLTDTQLRAAAVPVSFASQPLPAGTNRSGTITAGGTAQVLAAANAARESLVGQNISAGDIWINETGGTAAVDTAGSYKVASGQAFAVGTNRAISIIGATTGQKFTATET